MMSLSFFLGAGGWTQGLVCALNILFWICWHHVILATWETEVGGSSNLDLVSESKKRAVGADQ